MEQRTSHPILDKIAVIVFAAALLAVPLATFLLPTLTVSDTENRMLADRPRLTREALLDGSYFDSWETWFKDHIAGRDLMLRANTLLDLTVRDRSVVSDLLLTGERILPVMPQTDMTDVADRAASAADGLSSLNELVRSYGGTFLYVGVPVQADVFADEYPDGVYCGAEDRAVTTAAFRAALAEREVPFLDAMEVFAAVGGAKQFYMSTDHHYTLPGAHVLLQAILAELRAMGVEAELPDITFEELGRLKGSRSQPLFRLPSLSDPLYLGRFDEEIPFTRIDGKKAVESRVYHLPAEAPDYYSYGVYMGGDIPATTIQTDRPELPDLLIFGDSYTNAVETMAYAAFDTMRSLDLRYYREMKLSEYVLATKPDVVICIRDSAHYLDTTNNGNVR